MIILFFFLFLASLSFFDLKNNSFAQEESAPAESTPVTELSTEASEASPSEIFNTTQSTADEGGEQNILGENLDVETSPVSLESALGDLEEAIMLPDTTEGDLSELPLEAPPMADSADLSSMCWATLEAKEPWDVFHLKEWAGFEEEVIKNGGEIYYQLSLDNGKQWIYYNGEAWSPALDQNESYSTAAVINENIRSLPLNDAKVIFRAFFVNDCKDQIRLTSLKLNYKAEDSEVELEPLTKENDFNSKDLSESEIPSSVPAV